MSKDSGERAWNWFERWLTVVQIPRIRVSLLRFLTTHFSLEEIKTICFLLNIDYEELGGEGKTGKARELILHVERNSQLVGLVLAAQALRPNLDWESVDFLIRSFGRYPGEPSGWIHSPGEYYLRFD